MQYSPLWRLFCFSNNSWRNHLFLLFFFISKRLKLCSLSFVLFLSLARVQQRASVCCWGKSARQMGNFQSQDPKWWLKLSITRKKQQQQKKKSSFHCLKLHRNQSLNPTVWVYEETHTGDTALVRFAKHTFLWTLLLRLLPCQGFFFF